jgi:hypothetical protein
MTALGRRRKRAGLPARVASGLGRSGQDVIIPTAMSDEQARQKFPDGWMTLKPYLRVVAQPKD